jgi:hypothetical protein
MTRHLPRSWVVWVGRLGFDGDCTEDLWNQMKKSKKLDRMPRQNSTPDCLSHRPTTLHQEGILSSVRQNRHYERIKCFKWENRLGEMFVPRVPQRT